MENYFTALIFSKSRIKPPQFLYFLPGSQLVTPNFLSVVVGNLGYLGKLGNVAWTQNLSLIRKQSRVIISLIRTRILWKNEKNRRRTVVFCGTGQRQTLACKLISVQTEMTTLDRLIMGGGDSSLKKHGKLSVYSEGKDFGS